MKPVPASFFITHELSGRIRLIIPALTERNDVKIIERMFRSLQGVTLVRIEPLIQSMVIEYQQTVMKRSALLQFIAVFFKQTRFDPIDDLMVNVKPKHRADLFRSLMTGALLLVAALRKTAGPRPDFIDYLATVSTGYTVLSHGTNRFSHPDVLTGIISMLSLGHGNLLQVAALTWGVNLLEILHDMNRSKRLLPI
ncbi:HMA2 domain-containing protein [Paenibacillus turpanensis]|uniref:HMA2 domain-containing protein n=1 Tax=Paenibacillus turpanensis TaxID=2689078 RepID=UPI00140B74A6|nr:hypothetical protein [Paenibacillus turpanensis]